jgi:hypothetical protein
VLALDEEQRAEAVLKVTEGFARLVDQYVMTVTEGLCALESENGGVMAQPDIEDRKARILKGLDTLDGLMVSIRGITSTSS